MVMRIRTTFPAREDTSVPFVHKTSLAISSPIISLQSSSAKPGYGVPSGCSSWTFNPPAADVEKFKEKRFPEKVKGLLTKVPPA